MGKRRKILIAAGIYPPDIGGPATYARNLSTELTKLGWTVAILTYGEKEPSGRAGEVMVARISRRQNILSRYAKYFFAAWTMAKDADIVYVMGPVSEGLPAGLAAKARKRTAVLRLGGDWLWEKAVEAGWTNQPLMAYYKKRDSWSWREIIYARFMRLLLKLFREIIFSTAWQREIYINYYGLDINKTKIIENAFPTSRKLDDVILPSEDTRKEVTYAGRLLKLKNLELLLRAWQAIDRQGVRLLIYGQGPEESRLKALIEKLSLTNDAVVKKGVSQEELFRIIKKSIFTIMPSLSEISPNFALESLFLGKVVILTEENGFTPALKDFFVPFNPLDIEDLKAKLLYFLDEKKRKDFEEEIIKIRLPERSWGDLAAEHRILFSLLIK